MGDIVQILIVIGVIIFAVVKQLSSTNEEKKKQQPQMNPPQEDEEMAEIEFEFEKTSPEPFLSYDYDPPTPSRKTKVAEQYSSQKPTPKDSPILQEEPENSPEFDIQSPEEIRRGIIWSEILNRKY